MSNKLKQFRAVILLSCISVASGFLTNHSATWITMWWVQKPTGGGNPIHVMAFYWGFMVLLHVTRIVSLIASVLSLFGIFALFVDWLHRIQLVKMSNRFRMEK